ncbi:MAG TPA: zinc-binding dehydrogenase [bacterium]|nr:zinc-binding dehydrogenase [bacterium]
MLSWVKDGALRIRIDRTFPLAEASAAHARLEGRKALGKILLLPP